MANRDETVRRDKNQAAGAGPNWVLGLGMLTVGFLGGVAGYLLSQLQQDEVAPQPRKAKTSLNFDPAAVVAAGPGEPQCAVCLHNKVDCVLVPCMHAILCQACASRISNCPTCRQTVDSKERIFV